MGSSSPTCIRWDELPIGLDTPTTYTEEANTWRYDGQERFPVSTPEPQRVRWTQVPEYVLTGLEFNPEEYLGIGTTTIVDKYGRRWVLDDVDVELVEQKVQAYNAAVEAEYGVSLEETEERPGIEYPEDAGEWRESTVYSWPNIRDDCDSDPDVDVSEHSSDNLTAAAHPLGDRRKRIVIVGRQTPQGSTYFCSGTMVSSNHVLTAAHCVASTTTHYNPNNMWVCTQENLQAGAVCVGGDYIKTKYGKDTDQVEDDYALLRLDSSLSVGTFAISQASDSTIESNTHYHRGYPAFLPNCDNNWTNDNG